MRYSKQRELVLRTVEQLCDHPTAEEIFDKAAPECPGLSLGTVYRNLHQMAQEGRLRELPGPVSRFDGDMKPHTHFRCLCCGQVTDMVSVPYDTGLDQTAQADGWQVSGHILVFTGRCPTCAGREEPA